MRSVADSPDTPADASPEAELSEEGARRMVLLAVASLVALVLAAGVGLAVSRSTSGGDDQVVAAPDALAGTGTGPLAGTDVATYVEGRNRALREAKGRWVAVVSLRDYMTGPQHEGQFGSLDMKALLVAPHAGESVVVQGSLNKWATEARTGAEEERRQLEAMASTTEDKSFQDQFRADIDRLGKMVANLDPAKPVVFGMVVTGSADQLRELASKPEVRLVDLVGRRLPPDLEKLRGLRPEETTRAGDPLTRPL